MTKWQLRVKCLKKRDKLFEQNHHFHFSIVTCLLIRTDVSLFCAKQKRTCEVWNTGSYTNTTTNSWLLTANPLPQTVPTEPPDDSGSIRAGFAVPKAQMTSFSPPYTYKHCVISPCTSSAREKSSLCHMHCMCFSPLRFTTELILLTEKRHHQSSEFGKLFNGKLMV